MPRLPNLDFGSLSQQQRVLDVDNGQAERMVRTIKDATVRAFHSASIEDLRHRVCDWLLAYNCAKHLRALRFRSPL